MKQRLSILGSTGSIGVQTLDIVRENPDMFEVRVLTANSNWQRLAAQAQRRGDCVRLNQLALKGSDLMDAGVCGPGPRLGRLLSAALEEVIESRVNNDRADLLAWAGTQKR